MLEASLRYPLNSDDRVATLVIGGLLVGLPFIASLLSVFVGPVALLLVLLFLPLILVLEGYLLRVLQSSAAGEAAAPSFTNWGGLLVNGVKFLLVNAVYGLVVVIPTVMFLFVIVGVGSMSDGGQGSVAALGVVSLLFFVVITLLSLVLTYFLPAALTNFAVEGRLGAAFDLSTVTSVAFTTDYLVAVLLGVVLGGVINAVAGLFALLLVGIPFLFYGQVVTYYLFGRAYAEGRASAGLPPVTGTPEPAGRRTTERSERV